MHKYLSVVINFNKTLVSVSVAVVLIVAGGVYFLLMKRYPFKLSVVKPGPRHNPTYVKGRFPYADTYIQTLPF